MSMQASFTRSAAHEGIRTCCKIHSGVRLANSGRAVAFLTCNSEWWPFFTFSELREHSIEGRRSHGFVIFISVSPSCHGARGHRTYMPRQVSRYSK